MKTLKVGKRGQRGFTILELVVVLVVMAALAGLVVTLLPNLLPKTHGAIATTNLAELNKSLQMFSMLNLKQPNRLDSLIENGASDLYGGLPFDAATATALFSARNPTPDEIEALEESGITQVVNGSSYTPGASSATFDYDAAIETISSSSTLLFIDNAAGRAHLQEVLNIEPEVTPVGVYVAFGLGPKAAIVGNGNGGIAEAPVHFGEGESGSPAKAYSRYVIIYRVDRGRAQYIGVTAMHDDGFENGNGHLAEFYEAP